VPLDSQQVGVLVSRIRRGDIDAYGELVGAYQTEVWKVAAAIPGGFREIEELVQQTFVQAYRQLDSFDPRREFGPWIKEIARNQTRMELRRAARESGRLQRYYQEILSTADSDELPGNTLLEETLRNCRQELPEHLNEIVAQRYEEALSFEEIAARLGRSVAAARQLVSRARIALRAFGG
jgi:RNA polymerase sigma-70 factor (ECF subfamily)